MKSALKLVGLMVGIALVSAVLAPVLYQLLPMFKFERIFNRLVMIMTLAAVLIFVRFRKDTFIKYGLGWKGDSRKQLMYAFGLSVLVLLVLSVIRISLTSAVWAPRSKPLFFFVSQIINAILSGLLIGIIEEFFFRGFIFQSIRDRLRLGIPLAVVVTSIFYSSLHFIGQKKPYIDETPNFMDSLKLIRAPFEGLLDFPSFWMAAVGLFLFGLVLNYLVIRAGSLYPAIGMHAGCVFFVKTDGLFVNIIENDHVIYGSNKFYDGILGWAFILGLGLLISVVLKINHFNKERTAVHAHSLS